MPIIPFYGCERPELFAIERRATDRPGLVIEKLRDVLPDDGTLLDIGAGNGFTAAHLSKGREGRVVALEPTREMISPLSRSWVRGEGDRLPFLRSEFSGVYSTWAFFFPGSYDIDPGLREAERVLRPGGVTAIVNNLGGDEFSLGYRAGVYHRAVPQRVAARLPGHP